MNIRIINARDIHRNGGYWLEVDYMTESEDECVGLIPMNVQENGIPTVIPMQDMTEWEKLLWLAYEDYVCRES